MVGNKVQFAYIATGGSLPSTYPNPDTIYFLEEAKEIRVGGQLLANVDADAIDLATLASVLESYTVKSIEVAGSGDTVADVSFNTSSGKITVTKGNLPQLSKGAASTPTPAQLTPGGTFDVVTDTSVSGHTITDGKTRFTLPAQITNLLVSTSGNKVVFTLVFSDGSTTVVEYAGLGSAAFAATTDFATAAQGRTADAAMPADSGTATNAKVTLAHDPINNMEAATKQYVDNAVQGAASNLTFLGVTTSAVSDGGSEPPTINGAVIPISTLNMGDWVIYDNIQYIWEGTKWVAYGGDAHGVPESRRVDSGYGLTGGGVLSADLTISHDTKYSADVNDNSTVDLNVVDAISYDKAGHITAVGKKDVTNLVGTQISNATAPISQSVTALSTNLETNYYTSSDTDSAISTAVGTAVSQIPDIVGDEIDDKVTTDSEFSEMMSEIFIN